MAFVQCLSEADTRAFYSLPAPAADAPAAVVADAAGAAAFFHQNELPEFPDLDVEQHLLTSDDLFAPAAPEPPPPQAVKLVTPSMAAPSWFKVGGSSSALQKPATAAPPREAAPPAPKQPPAPQQSVPAAPSSRPMRRTIRP